MQTNTLKVAELAREGMSDKDVADLLCLKQATVAKYRRAAGLHRSLKRWLAEDAG